MEQKRERWELVHIVRIRIQRFSNPLTLFLRGTVKMARLAPVIETLNFHRNDRKAGNKKRTDR